jgi:hypothetical protein
VKALTKEKNEKENVLIDLDLMILKNVSMLQFEELKKKDNKGREKEVAREKEGILEESVTIVSTRREEEYRPSWC